jgi:hypothetical protein
MGGLMAGCISAGGTVIVISLVVGTSTLALGTVITPPVNVVEFDAVGAEAPGAVAAQPVALPTFAWNWTM